jgi:hypothetical protein
MLIYCFIRLANAWSATPVAKKTRPWLDFFSKTLGESNEDSKYDPGSFSWAIFSAC